MAPPTRQRWGGAQDSRGRRSRRGPSQVRRSTLRDGVSVQASDSPAVPRTHQRFAGATRQPPPGFIKGFAGANHRSRRGNACLARETHGSGGLRERSVELLGDSTCCYARAWPPASASARSSCACARWGGGCSANTGRERADRSTWNTGGRRPPATGRPAGLNSSPEERRHLGLSSFQPAPVISHARTGLSP